MSRGTFGSLWGHFGATLGPRWVHGGDFISLWDQYGMIVDHFGYMKVRFQKTLISPTDFNDFIKLRSESWTALCDFRVTSG